MRRAFHAAACLVLSCSLLAGPIQAQVFRGYYSSGSLKFKAKKEKRKQIITGYYPAGSLEFIAPYRKGKLHGTVKEYHENGLLKAEIPYERGKRDGLARFYYGNGMLMCKIEYRNDRETGMAKFYDENGLLSGSISLDKHRLRPRRRVDEAKAALDDTAAHHRDSAASPHGDR